MKKIAIIIVIGLIVVPVMIVYAYNKKINLAVLELNTILHYYMGLLTIIVPSIMLVWQYKTRKKDEEIMKAKEDRKSKSDLLCDSLSKFDMSVFSEMIKYVDRYKDSNITYATIETPKKISTFISQEMILSLIEKANTNTSLKMKFSPSEREFFRSVLTDLNKFTKEYISLLHELQKSGDQSLDGGYIVGQILKRIRTLCQRFSAMEGDIERALDEFRRQYDSLNSKKGGKKDVSVSC